MKIFITGGSGFVGGHVIEKLAGTHELKAMARSERAAAQVEALGATAVRCSLDDVDAEAMKGCDAVVHAAARVEDWGTLEDFHRANVEGTRRVLEAARAAGVRRFVLVSTNATLFDGTNLLGVDEARPYPTAFPFPYAQTKAEAERLVLAAHGSTFSTVALRPCFIWGPRDNSVLPTLKRMVDSGSFAWLDGGRARVSTTHVANLVAAIERAVVGEQTGAFFIADEDDTSIRDFLSGLASTHGLSLPARSMPGSLARSLGWLLDSTWNGLGVRKAPPLTRMAAEVSSRDMTVRTARARQELGWAPVMTRQAGLESLRSEASATT